MKPAWVSHDGERCSLCEDDDAKGCGIVFAGMCCTRKFGHAGDCAACGPGRDLHPISVWNSSTRFPVAS